LRAFAPLAHTQVRLPSSAAARKQTWASASRPADTQPLARYHLFAMQKWDRRNSSGDTGEKTSMTVEAILIWLVVGAIAGWAAGQVVTGGGFGLVGDIVVGIVGAIIAGLLLPRLGVVIGSGIISAIINAFIGAVILLLIVRLIRR